MKTFIVKFEDQTEMWLNAKSRAELLKTLRIFGVVNKVTKVTEVKNEQ